jgi:hypothetical protein
MIGLPLAYRPDLESSSAGEADAIGGLQRALRKIQETTSRDYGHAVRGVHAKAHAIVRGRLHVRELSGPFAQGLFAVPGDHDAILRFSTNPGDVLDDAVSVPRGLALKVLAVSGERLPEAPEPDTQDFLLANGPAFGAADPGGFLRLLRLLALTTDRGEPAKKFLSRMLGAAQAALEAIGHNSRTLPRLGGAPNVHPLGETYFSQTPFLYGRHIAKFQLQPVSAGLRAAGKRVGTRGRPDALREEIARILAEQGGVWDLRVQLCVDPQAMPIEDATAVWSETLSPFVAVATLTVPPQVSWRPGTSDALDQRLAFNVWNGLVAHRPLGGINRARKATYESSASYRAAFNGCPVHRPADVWCGAALASPARTARSTDSARRTRG